MNRIIMKEVIYCYKMFINMNKKNENIDVILRFLAVEKILNYILHNIYRKTYNTTQYSVKILYFIEHIEIKILFYN